MNTTERYNALLNNDLSHYLVDYKDGSVKLRHASELSSILECGEPADNYGIRQIQQCWNGEELGVEGEV